MTVDILKRSVQALNDVSQNTYIHTAAATSVLSLKTEAGKNSRLYGGFFEKNFNANFITVGCSIQTTEVTVHTAHSTLLRAGINDWRMYVS